MSYRKSTDFLLSIPSNRSFESTRQNRNFSISSLNMKPVTFIERGVSDDSIDEGGKWIHR